MKNTTKIIKYIAISGFVLSVSIKTVFAFGFMPPMPGEPVNDPLTNVNKMFAYGQDMYNKVQTQISQLKTLNLNSLKGFAGFVDGLGIKKSSADSDETLKTPGMGTFARFNAGGVSVGEGSLNEQEFQDMYYALFFTYPSAEEGDYDITKTAYRHKAKEYKQDVIVNTYITGRYTEDYLATIDKTLVRLDDCIQGKKEGEKECTFFGMQVVKPTAPEEGAEAPEAPEEGDNGQLGIAMNAYVVTTIYDRLLRIVEDLTAAEAIFRAAQQIDMVNPVSENESSAAEYLDNGMRFAYSDSHNNAHAISLINKKKYSAKCKGNSGGNCPRVNSAVADIESVKDSSVFKDLQYISAEANKVAELHNLKSSLHEYKTLYRQYLMLKKIHDKAFKVLKESDNCTIAFLNRHRPENTNGATIWYGETGQMTDKMRNKYDERKGLSGWLINAYNQKSTQVTIGTSSECNGYYEVCPAGYEIDESKEPCIDRDVTYYACGVKMVTQDGSAAANGKINIDGWKETDGFVNGADSETIQEEGRRQAELTWDIGRDGVMRFMTKYGAQFNLWNDQKVFQAEYLRQKYRNMRLIIESADIGSLSYDIGTSSAGNDNTPDTVGVGTLIKHITVCQSPEKAKEAARQKYCSGYTSSNCVVDFSNGNVVTKKYVIRNGKKELMVGYPIVENQKVSVNDSCTYKSDTLSMTDIDSKINNSSFCLTPSCLVKNFYPAVLGANSHVFANHEKRITAADYVADVMITRKNEEAKLQEWIRNKVSGVETLKRKLTAQKSALSSINKNIDKARTEKNKLSDELSRVNERLKAITKEKAELTNRQKQLSNSAIDKKVINQKIKALDEEERCINGKGTNCSKYIKNAPDDTKLYMRKANIEDGMKSKDVQVKSYQSRLDGYKEDIEKLEKQIKDETESFAGEYITKAEKMQSAIEDANDIFENFMEDKDGNPKAYRMKTKQKKICYNPKPLGLGCKSNGKDYERLTSENVATTLQKVIYYENNLDAAIKKGMNDKFFSVANKANIASVFRSIGMPTNFYVDETFAMVNLAAGNVSVDTLVTKVKDTLIDIATQKVNNIITQSDEVAAQEIEAAKAKIKGFTDKYHVGGDGDPTVAPSSDIYDVEKYGELRTKHLELIENLRKPVSPETIAAGISDLSTIFGIPTKGELIDMVYGDTDINIPDKDIYDVEYFVGLPARGNIYHIASDENAGRDFIPPKSPLVGLPPLREVFYFSTEEYNDIPQNGGKPALSHLLMGKYCDGHGNCAEEYLPEVWLHLLASPNMRADHKYQQTFVERSFSRDNINKLLKNQISNLSVPGADPTHYRTIISRASVFPCRADGVIVDVDSDKDKVENMRYLKRNSSPAGMGNIQNCQEVATRINNICEGKSGQVCHLLADHGNKSDDKQKLDKTSTKPLYEKYSELGQLLKENLAYNPLQKAIQEYLQDNDNNKMKNNITRQRAEQASFKRNVMGSFLKAVIAEDKALKALEQNEKDIKGRLTNLCTQLHEVGVYLDKEQDNRLIEKRYADLSEVEDDCANIIMSGGLATSPEDNKYDVDCEKLDVRSYYEQIFCVLDDVKDGRLNVVKKKANEKSKILGKDEDMPLVVKEQLDEINNLIRAMENDGEEYMEILPDTNSADMKIDEAKTNRKVVIEKAEEGMRSMENQTQSAAYCPIY